jgi:hypothetical protein
MMDALHGKLEQLVYRLEPPALPSSCKVVSFKKALIKKGKERERERKQASKHARHLTSNDCSNWRRKAQATTVG